MSSSQQGHILSLSDDRGHRRLTLDAPSYSIGRDAKCDIPLVSQFVSHRHATLIQIQNGDGTSYYRIVDGEVGDKPSRSGLLVNGVKVQARDLKHKDQIIFAPRVHAMYFRGVEEKGRVDQQLYDSDNNWDQDDDWGWDNQWDVDDPDDFGGCYARLNPRRPSPLDAAADPNENLHMP